jgi:hypothetical protein
LFDVALASHIRLAALARNGGRITIWRWKLGASRALTLHTDRVALALRHCKLGQGPPSQATFRRRLTQFGVHLPAETQKYRQRRPAVNRERY